MQVVTRKIGETIQIGDDITITLVQVERGKIRLAIEAPRDIAIFREELLSPSDPRLAPKPPEVQP